MSLLLDALKKAEAKQGEAHTAAGPQGSRLELEALEQIKAPARSQTAHVHASHTPPASRAGQANVRQSMQAQLAARAALSRNRGALDWLTFPVAVAAVLIVGGLTGGYVLYRSYTSMPSAVGLQTAASPTHGSVLTDPALLNAPRRDNTLLPVAAQAPLATVVPQNASQPRVALVSPAPVAAPAAPASMPKAAPVDRSPTPTFSHQLQAREELSQSLNAGYQALQQDDRASALAHYQRALQLDASNLDALLGLGYVAQQDNRTEAATVYFRQALSLDPRNPYALTALANMNDAANVNGTASESRLKYLSAHTAGTEEEISGALQFALGNTLAAQLRWDEAQQAYFNAVAAQPRNPDYLFNLAVSLDQLHQSQPALDYYRKALAAANAMTAHFDAQQVAQRAQALEHALKQAQKN
ncbi:MAG: tetratricopeptide repeat protein [Burkholderiaceae bacterium]|nr:MAG: tetratricopeptide repeat protein [Burkholderiaceae bacterium]